MVRDYTDVNLAERIQADLALFKIDEVIAGHRRLELYVLVVLRDLGWKITKSDDGKTVTIVMERP